MVSLKRQRRLNDLLQSTIADIIMFSLKDPRISFVTISKVLVTNDLKSAKVYVSLREKDEKVIAALQKAAPFIQHKTGEMLKLRFTPKFEFLYDENLDYSIRINKIIDEISNERQE